MDITRYSYSVQWSDEDEVFLSRVLEIPGLMAHGETQEEALAEIREAAAGAIDALQERGESVPEPIATKNVSGKLLLRLSPERYRELAVAAAREGTSINTFVLDAIAFRLGEERGRSLVISSTSQNRVMRAGKKKTPRRKSHG